jgi:hypothetical protein
MEVNVGPAGTSMTGEDRTRPMTTKAPVIVPTIQPIRALNGTA